MFDLSFPYFKVFILMPIIFILNVLTVLASDINYASKRILAKSNDYKVEIYMYPTFGLTALDRFSDIDTICQLLGHDKAVSPYLTVTNKKARKIHTIIVQNPNFIIDRQERHRKVIHSVYCITNRVAIITDSQLQISNLKIISDF